MHKAVPVESEYLPAGQLVQLEAALLTALYFPMEHERQELLLVCPVEGWYVPPGHDTQPGMPLPYVPVPHGVRVGWAVGAGEGAGVLGRGTPPPDTSVFTIAVEKPTFHMPTFLISPPNHS